MKLSQVFQIKILRKLEKAKIDKDHLFFALTLFVGVLSGLTAVSLSNLITWFSEFFKTSHSPSISSVTAGIIAIFISGLITTRFESWSSGSGIPQTKISLVVHHGLIKFRQWFSKLIASIMSLSSGIPLGLEGPTVSVTSGIGSSFARFFGLGKVKVKSMLAVGAAGGIAAAFNTPIAAVTFVLEEIVGNFNSKSLGPIMISSVAASVTAQTLHGNHSTFSLLKYKFEDPKELVFYLILGLICAFIGPLWVKLILQFRKWHKHIFKEHKLTIMLVSFGILILFANYNPSVLGSGHDVINDVLLSKITDWKFILSLLVIKFLFTSLIYSSGISGGLFMPTLFMGAMVGAIVGNFAHMIYPNVSETGAYAVVGMGAFFAAVMRTPFSSIMFIFEMTQDYKVILPLMIANISSYLISQKFSKGSIYELISEQDGIHLPQKEDYEILDSITVEDAMVKDVITLNSNLSVKEALKKIQNFEISGYPILKNGLIFGVISTTELASAFAKYQGECFLSEVCTKKVITIHPDQSLMLAFHLLKQYKVSRIVVVSRINNKKIVGIITAENIVNRFGFHIQEDSKLDIMNDYINSKDSDEVTG